MGPRLSPAELIERARKDIHSMCQQNGQMLTLTARAFATQSTTTLESANNLGRDIHRLEKALTEMIVKHLAGEEKTLEANKEILFVPMHLERVGDNIEFLIRAVHTMINAGIPFTDRAIESGFRHFL